MQLFTFSLILHLIAATIWVGGHILLVFTVLIPTLKSKDLAPLLAFEQRYEKVGMPALVVLIITGLFQAYSYQPEISEWFQWENHISRHIMLKLIFLFSTFSMALNVKFNLLKRSPIPLPILAGHIITVTVISILFLITGVSFKYAIF